VSPLSNEMNEAPMIRHGIGKWLRAVSGSSAGDAGGSTAAVCRQATNINAAGHRMHRMKYGFRMAVSFQSGLLTELDAAGPAEVPRSHCPPRFDVVLLGW